MAGFGSLAVRDGRLWLRPDRRHGARLRFEPTALMVVHHGGETAMPWEEHRRSERGEGWHCFGTPGTQWNRPAVTVLAPERREAPYTFPTQESWSVPSPWITFRFAFAETAALVQWAATEPRARSGLSDVDRLDHLLAVLRSTTPRFERWPPEPHLMGDKLDVDRVILRTLDHVGVRLVGGRPVRGEPIPEPESLISPVMEGLPAWVRDRVSSEQVVGQARRFLEVRPWPFDCLHPDGPSDAGSRRLQADEERH